MKILVTAKRVEDPESKIKVKPDGSGIVQEGLKYKINPFDEIAVEEGLRLAAKHGGEVVVVSIGGKEVQEQLRHALAMGATKAVWVNHAGPLDQMAVAGAAAEGRREGEAGPRHPRQAVASTTTRTRSASTSPSGWAGARRPSPPRSSRSSPTRRRTRCRRISVGADGKTRPGGARGRRRPRPRCECTLPAVVTTDLRLNLPRYASLPGIMKAKSKPIEELHARGARRRRRPEDRRW